MAPDDSVQIQKPKMHRPRLKPILACQANTCSVRVVSPSELLRRDVYTVVRDLSPMAQPMTQIPTGATKTTMRVMRIDQPKALATVMGGQQVCIQTFRPCNDGGVIVTTQYQIFFPRKVDLARN